MCVIVRQINATAHIRIEFAECEGGLAHRDLDEARAVRFDRLRDLFQLCCPLPSGSLAPIRAGRRRPLDQLAHFVARANLVRCRLVYTELTACRAALNGPRPLANLGNRRVAIGGVAEGVSQDAAAAQAKHHLGQVRGRAGIVRVRALRLCVIARSLGCVRALFACVFAARRLVAFELVARILAPRIQLTVALTEHRRRFAGCWGGLRRALFLIGKHPLGEKLKFDRSGNARGVFRGDAGLAA